MTTGRAQMKILIVDDEPIKRSVLADGLRAAGHSPSSAANPLEAEPLLAKTQFDVILTDLRMPGQDGLSFLRNLKRQRPEQPVIVMTAYGTVDTAVEAMKLGAFDYLQKPFLTEELLLKLDRLFAYTQLESENEALRRELAPRHSECRIVGHSEPICQVLTRIHALAGVDTTVLIEGESGTGKELVARKIHETSARATGPFVALMCAALPRDLMETELFGHEPGAFTGATGRRVGRFELAHGGTIFLDDVDDIPLDLQVKLLRVLQERTFERVGGGETIHTNVRIIAATKSSISDLVAAGKFREDLYYRLNVVLLRVPPLRERLDDIPDLVAHFMHELAVKMNRAKLVVTPSAIAKLQMHSWPGNIRELEHALEQMVALLPDDLFDVDDIPELGPPRAPGSPVSMSLEGLDHVNMDSILADVEARLIRWALTRADGNLTGAASILETPRSTLQYRAGKINAEGPPAPGPDDTTAPSAPDHKS